MQKNNTHSGTKKFQDIRYIFLTLQYSSFIKFHPNIVFLYTECEEFNLYKKTRIILF